MASLFVVCLVDSVLSLRRAIVLTKVVVIYRPPVGAVTVVPLAEITGVGRGYAVSGSTFILRPTGGVRLTAGKRVETFPLTVKDSAVLFDKLQRIVRTPQR
jgi:hypothetical protein